MVSVVVAVVALVVEVVVVLHPLLHLHLCLVQIWESLLLIETSFEQAWMGQVVFDHLPSLRLYQVRRSLRVPLVPAISFSYGFPSSSFLVSSTWNARYPSEATFVLPHATGS